MTVCPSCGADLPSQSGDEATTWSAVARVTNLAEAGFLVDRLQSDGIPAQLRQDQHFNAVAGNWATAYELRVPADRQPAATQLLREEVARGDIDDADGDVMLELAEAARQAHSARWARWGTVLLTVAGLSFLLGRMVEIGDRPPPPRATEFWIAMQSGALPLVATDEQGRVVRVLRFLPDEDALLLEFDADGDGRFERRERFRRPR